MAIAESNGKAPSYLSIDSEVLLLAFDPEVREVARVFKKILICRHYSKCKVDAGYLTAVFYL